MSCKEKVCELLSDQGCGVMPLADIQEQSLLFELGFDSLRYMELVVLLEETFALELPDEALEITASTTVADLIRVVEQCHD